MNKVIPVMFCIFVTHAVVAIDINSYYFINHVSSITKAGKPELYEDVVIFTAPSRYRHVGIAFAHEGFSSVHWFKKMVTLETDPELIKKGNTYIELDVLVYIWTVPEDIQEVEYRLVLDGLWTVDPLNPLKRLDRSTGLVYSVFPVPVVRHPSFPFEAPVGKLQFSYQAAPGETITVAGSFNNWDPFMYQLKEINPGHYYLDLPLPPGSYQYVFVYQGKQIIDPNNPTVKYDRTGRAASEATVR
ncbi:MAG: glycogen-binding domain-containing protein [Treponema sp.]|nr:glycogen-binding domain-containing protein [Treponema sp.]